MRHKAKGSPSLSEATLSRHVTCRKANPALPNRTTPSSSVCNEPPPHVCRDDTSKTYDHHLHRVPFIPGIFDYFFVIVSSLPQTLMPFIWPFLIGR